MLGKPWLKYLKRLPGRYLYEFTVALIVASGIILVRMR